MIDPREIPQLRGIAVRVNRALLFAYVADGDGLDLAALEACRKYIAQLDESVQSVLERTRAASPSVSLAAYRGKKQGRSRAATARLAS